MSETDASMEERTAGTVFVRLEQRMDATSQKLAELTAKYDSLVAEKGRLEHEISTLRTNNQELSDNIHELKLLQQKNSSSFDKEEVRKKIDRMLEKFGELQL